MSLIFTFKTLAIRATVSHDGLVLPCFSFDSVDSVSPVKIAIRYVLTASIDWKWSIALPSGENCFNAMIIPFS